MHSAFWGDGFLYEAQSSVAEREQFVYLIPETEFEDIGISYFFKSNDTLYQVLIYSSQNARNISTLEKYYVCRFGSFNYIEEYDSSAVFAGMVYIYETADGNIYARTQIDKTHYTEIRADKHKFGIGKLKSFFEHTLI